ncbi:MAG: hypothetical protein PVJ05_09445 [Candidatus Thorarchaeota archaeon]|jgi:hypothetical protein
MAGVIELSRSTGKRLLTWSIGSLIIGIVLLFSSPGTIFGGIGVQAIIWGTIDVFFAAYILLKQKEQSVEKIASTVYKNIYLDIVYQVVGFFVIVVFLHDPYIMGNGIGVIIQGFFLLLLDLYYYRALRNLE